MRPPLYVAQLRRDLEMWIEQGLVPAKSRDAILASVGGASQRSLSSIFAVLGVVLLGAAAMSFVAANWEAMSKLVRLVVLFGAMWAAYGVAVWQIAKKHDAFAQAAVLLGVLMFGVNIMLVAQTYHIQAHYPDGVLLWGLGALAAAWIVPSRPAVSVALLLGGFWTYYEVVEFGGGPHWLFLPYWLACFALIARNSWSGEWHVAVLTLLAWLAINTEAFVDAADLRDAEIVSLYVILFSALWAFGRVLEAWGNAYARTLQRYGVFLVLLVFAALTQTSDDGAVSAMWSVAALALGGALAVGLSIAKARGAAAGLDMAALGAAAGVAVLNALLTAAGSESGELPWLLALLGLIVWTIVMGARIDDRFTVNLGFVAFGFWTLYVYAEVFGTLLDTAAFFLVGGVILIVMSVFLERLRRSVIAREAAP